MWVRPGVEQIALAQRRVVDRANGEVEHLVFVQADQRVPEFEACNGALGWEAAANSVTAAIEAITAISKRTGL